MRVRPRVLPLLIAASCVAWVVGLVVQPASAQLNRVSVNQIVGTLNAATFPALTGDVTTTAGSLATTIGATRVTNAMLAGSIDLTAKVTGTLPVGNGGTGVATLTNHGIVLGQAGAAVAATAACGTGTVVYGQGASADPICSTLTLPNAATTGTYLVATGTNALAAVAPALSQAQPADQTARSSSSVFVMMGLGAAAAPCTITPVATGRVVFVITGDIVNNTTASTVTVQMAESTGSAPANNAAASGTVISRALETDQVTSVLKTAFTLIATKTGLALSTAVWFDLQLKTSSTNTGQPTNVDCTAHEI